MTMVTTISLDQFIDEMPSHGDADDHRWYIEQYLRLGARVFERGDVLLVYVNDDLSHRDLGLTQVCSYGSAASQIEASRFPEPPSTMPDIGGNINWRYQLHHIIDRRYT